MDTQEPQIFADGGPRNAPLCQELYLSEDITFCRFLSGLTRIKDLGVCALLLDMAYGILGQITGQKEQEGSLNNSISMKCNFETRSYTCMGCECSEDSTCRQ
jgi:hypothetical protein